LDEVATMMDIDHLSGRGLRLVAIAASGHLNVVCGKKNKKHKGRA
jgi:hypothetical protein